MDIETVSHVVFIFIFLNSVFCAIMGLLTEGKPLTWEETKQLADHVRQHGIDQFLNLYHQLLDRKGDVLKWGDEVEYIIVKFDHTNKIARVRLCAQDILGQLNEKEANDPHNVKSLWRPEYGAYMIEGTPGKPYGGLLAHFNIVEANMRYRREEAQQLLGPDEVLMTITNFPSFRWPRHRYNKICTHMGRICVQAWMSRVHVARGSADTQDWRFAFAVHTGLCDLQRTSEVLYAHQEYTATERGASGHKHSDIQR